MLAPPQRRPSRLPAPGRKLTGPAGMADDARDGNSLDPSPANRSSNRDEAAGETWPRRRTRRPSLVSVTPPTRMGGSRGSDRSPAIQATTLSHHQQVVIVIRDARHVPERLTHALAEGVDRRAEGVICIQSEGRIVIVGGLFDESSERCGDRLRDRLRPNRREGSGGLQSRSQILDPIESRFPRGELGKVVAPDRAAVLLGRARVDDELAGGGEHPRRLVRKPGEVNMTHRIETGHHVTADGPEREGFDGPDQVTRTRTRASVADARLREHGWTQIQTDGHDPHGEC